MSEAGKPDLQAAKNQLVEAEIAALTEAEKLMSEFVAGMQAISAKLPKGGIPSHIVSFVDKIAANTDHALQGELAQLTHYYRTPPAMTLGVPKA